MAIKPRKRYFAPKGGDETSVLSTLLRFLFLIGGTLGSMALIRWVPAVSAFVQKHVLALPQWWTLYGLLGIHGALAREQCMLVVLASSCFVSVLAIQLMALKLWRGRIG